MMADWEQVVTLVGAAGTLEGADRQAFLDAACASDPALRAQVDARLGDEQDEGTLGRLAAVSTGAAGEDVVGPLAPGQTLNGRYHIDGMLGVGGQALVYRATDRSLSRQVVVKVMRATGPERRWLTTRVAREMHALARIDHPGVVGILDVGTLASGAPFLVIQYVSGRSLREVLKAGPLERARAARLLRQLGAALQAAHTAGVAHQDLKPENIMMQPSGDANEVAKLIDFGIAKVDRAPFEAGVSTVMVAGTVRYMAPEQFEGESSPASDVYALARVTCEMLSGQPDLRFPRPRLRAASRRLLELALARRADDRPRHVGAWSEALAESLVERTWSARRLAAWLGVPLLAAVAVTNVPRLIPDDNGELVRVVQKVGAFDPLDEGFLPHNQVTGTVSFNTERTGYDGWRVFGTGAGDFYHKPLTDAQKRQAAERGWTLSADMRLEEGGIYAVVDLLGHGRRFDIGVQREADGTRVRLNTQIVPTFAGIDVSIPGLDEGYHHYELRYDQGLQTAELWVDGTRRAEGYRGHTQFQEADQGLLFGAAPYRGDRGAGSFQSVRFEINP